MDAASYPALPGERQESLQRQRTPPVDKGAMAAWMKGHERKNMDAQGRRALKMGRVWVPNGQNKKKKKKVAQEGSEAVVGTTSGERQKVSFLFPLAKWPVAPLTLLS